MEQTMTDITGKALRGLRLLAAVLTAALALAGPCRAGNPADPGPKVKWLATEYDFGSIREADGEVTGSVSFVNEGGAPTFISRVRPSCGCTSASYPKSMIAPGDTATVRFTYNPAGRPGKFDKTVRIWLDSEGVLTVVRIFGTVVGEKQTLEWAYPIEAGALRMEKDRLEAGTMKRGDARHLFLTLCNQTADSVTPAWVFKGEAVKIDMAPATIPPGDLGVMSFYWRSSAEKENGPVEETVVLIPDSRKPEETKEVVLSATVMPADRPLTAETLAKAPLAHFSQPLAELGKVTSGKIPFEFILENKGAGTLHIDRIYTHFGNAVAITKAPKKIKPGQSAHVKGHLDGAALPAGPFRVVVEVLTDDPVHPAVTAEAVGEKIASDTKARSQSQDQEKP